MYKPRALSEAGQAADGSAAELVLRAAEPWSSDGHDLFPAAVRARAVELLRLGVLLSWQPRFQGVGGALLDAWRQGVIPRAVGRYTCSRSRCKIGSAVLWAPVG
jgi:hypothetical protein